MNKLLAFVVQTLQQAVAIVQGFSSGLATFGKQAPQKHVKEFSVEVVRPDDLLVVTLDFYNLRIKSPGGSPELQRPKPGHGFIVAHFPPQSFAERAFFEQSEQEPGTPPQPPDDPLNPPPVGSRISGRSQLVFRIEDSLLPMDFKLETILDALTKSEPLTQAAIRKPFPIPNLGQEARFGGEGSQFSAIESPYRLILSPNLESRWQHAVAPVQDPAAKRTELWHTRLTGDGPTVSAVWSPDYAGPNPSPAPDEVHPFRMSLHNENRHEIVRSTADPDLAGAHPVDVNLLMLSSQGAWMNLTAEWQTELNLVEWKHRSTAGRDQFVKVVKEGHMFCLGHRAVFIKITERKVIMGKGGQVEGKPVAYLRQRVLINIKEPTKTYSHHDSPFRSVTIRTLTTPNLDLPSKDDIFDLGENAFWPIVLNKLFEFDCVGIDWEGRQIEFSLPLAFVVKTRANNKAQMDPIITLYNGLSEGDPKRKRPMGGQKIAFAPSTTSGDTTYETTSMVLGATGSTGTPQFLPAMAKSDCDVPAVRQISGNSAKSTIYYDDDYRSTTGNTIGNMGEVFAHLVARTPVTFPAEKTGGMVAPNFDISGLSRAFGPVGGDVDNFANGTFNPTDVFKNVKLLGGIPLSSIMNTIINATPGVAGTNIPQLQTIRTTAEIDGIPKDVFQTIYRWDIDSSLLINTGLYKPESDATFFIQSITNTPLDGSAGNFTVDGGLTNFAVTLLSGAELVAVHFTSAKFAMKQNAKVDFEIVFSHFEFLGSLQFVNKLKDVIPMDGLQDPPFLDLVGPPQPGVKVGFTLGIPTVGVGIFTLQNISFGAVFYLGFLGDPANLRLNFCERHQPFILTVSLFGGGGFFAIDIGMDGVKQIEAALEFGAAIALNLGVAAGSASIMGGVYYQKSGTGFEVSAYFRAAGCLSVLGIISISVELYIALTYSSKGMGAHGGKLWGQASITVKIKIAFFSIKVGISIEREFAGSDPTFIETVAPSDWQEYCGAFADYPA